MPGDYPFYFNEIRKTRLILFPPSTNHPLTHNLFFSLSSSQRELVN